MPATFVFITADQALFEEWARQLPSDRTALSGAEALLANKLPPGIPVVLVLDSDCSDQTPITFDRWTTLLVGEPYTTRFEEAKKLDRNKHVLSYEESRTDLFRTLRLLEEIAERGATIDLLMEKMRRFETSKPSENTRNNWRDNPEMWDFLEGAIENLSSRERLLSEFRRGSRYLLRASHTVFFLRHEGGFKADRGASFLPLEEPIVSYLATHPLVLDGIHWPGPADPIAELSARNRMALWGARLLVPLHENGHLIGLISCGVRDDGQPYNDSDKAKAVFVGRLFKQFLAGSTQLSRLNSFDEKALLSEKYLPHTLLLSADEEPPRTVPLAVRSLVGRVRRIRDASRITPSLDQPFRAGAGFINETGGVWAYWEEASNEVFDRAQKAKLERLDLLKEIALTLNHEIGNSLVSLTTIRQASSIGLPPALISAIKTDINRIELLNAQLGHLAALTEAGVELVDFRQLIKLVGDQCDVQVEVGPEPVALAIAPKLVEFALESILKSILENRDDVGKREVLVQLRAAGTDDKLTALVSIKGRNLELEGILPEVTPDSTPNQGKMGVFIGKEVIRLHGGAIHSGPGLEGTEILISIRKW